MASPAKICFLLFLFTITLSSHQILARDSQFFNKVPSSNNNNGVTEVVEPNKQQQPFNKLPEEEPNFIPENENSGYGLYGHESGQLPPSTTNNNGEPYKTTNNIPYNNGVQDSFPANAKYLPKNYNTEAYVTEPEGYTPTTTSTSTSVPENNHNNYNPFSIPNSKYLPKNYNTESYVTEPEGYIPTTQEHYNENNNHNYYYNGENGYHNDQQQYSTSANANNYYYDSNRQQQRYNTGANNNYNSFAQRDTTTTTTTAGGNNNYDHYSNGAGNSNGYQKQGMSDTRFLENGKYYYDINLEKTTFNPNDENTREFGYGNRGYYSNNNNNNNMNTYEYNNQNYAGFQNNHDQFQNFQDEEDLP